MIRTAAYIRVSTQEQKLHGISLDAQRDKLREYAKSHNLELVAWYEDEGVSGRKLIKNRPELQRMISDAEAGLFSHIIFIKLDRFFRSVAEYHECMKRLGDVTWDATEENYDLSTSNGRMLVNMKLTIAENEADQTGERIRLVNEYKVKTGQPVTGSMPWSHRISDSATGKRIVVNEDNREHCLDVINYYLTTNSLRKTLMYCDQYHSFYDIRGLKSWLSNSMLMGCYRDNSEYCEALIDAPTFEMLQDKLTRNVRQPKQNPSLFSGLLKCPECGKSLVASTWSVVKNGTRYRYKRYRCDGYSFKRGCSHSTLYTENQIEKCLLAQLEDYVSNRTAASGFAQVRPVIDASKVKSELDRINYMFEKGRITVDEYDQKYTMLQNRLRDAYSYPSAENEKLNKVSSILTADWKEVYASLDAEHRRDFWHVIAREIHISKNGRKYTLESIIFV